MSTHLANDFGGGAGAVLLVAGIVVIARVLTRIYAARETLIASFAGGVSLAFVLLELFVQLVEGADHDLPVRAGPEPVHTTATLILVGACLAFAANLYGARRRESWRTYGIALVPQVAYRVLVGAALDEELQLSGRAFVLFLLVMVLHLGVAEHRMVAAYPREHRGWRQLLAASAPLAGTALWAWTEPTLATFHALLALVAGATILGIFREEIPAAKDTHVGAFFAGVALFGIIVQAHWWM